MGTSLHPLLEMISNQTRSEALSGGHRVAVPEP